jgi:hypothetical protein
MLPNPVCRNLGTFTHRKEQQKPLTVHGYFLTRRTMASDYKRPSDDSSFTFAVQELKQARAAAQALGLDPGPKKVSYKEQGSDPYNSSGSFDRTKNWTRVGKR